MFARLVPKPPLVRPPGWQWLYDARDRGMVPASQVVRIALDSQPLARSILVVPPDVPTEQIDYSAFAGLDLFVFIDQQETPYRRLKNCTDGLQAASVESLRIIAPGQMVATLKVGHPQYRGGYLKRLREQRDCA